MQGSPCKGYASDQHQVSTAIRMDLELFHVTSPRMPVPQDGHTAHHKATPLPGRLKYADFFFLLVLPCLFFSRGSPENFHCSRGRCSDFVRAKLLTALCTPVPLSRLRR